MSTEDLAAAERARDRQVLELHHFGLPFDVIAAKEGYGDPEAAYLAYRRAMSRQLRPDLDEAIILEADRLDRLQVAHWGNAIRGDAQATTTILKVMERRSKLLGLDHSDAVAERQMRLNEAAGGMVVHVISRVLEALGLSEEQRALADEVVPRELRAVTRVVEGGSEAG